MHDFHILKLKSFTKKQRQEIYNSKSYLSWDLLLTNQTCGDWSTSKATTIPQNLVVESLQDIDKCKSTCKWQYGMSN